MLLPSPFNMKNHKKEVLFFLFSISLLAISSCKKENRWDMFKGTGKKVSETRALAPFTKILLEDNVNVVLSPGHTQEVRVEAGEKLISLVRTEADTNTIHIYNDNKCNWARSYKKGTITVYITMPTLRYIWHNGSGDITCTDTIHCDTINIQPHESGNIELTLNANVIFNQLHGNSDVTLHGKCPIMGIFHIGEGYLHAEDLQTDDVWIHTEASGNEYLNVKKELTASIEWAGSAYYKGNPATVTGEVKGNGKLIPIN